MRRTPFLLILGIAAVALVGGYTGYLIFQNSTLNAETQRVERTLMGLEEKVLQFKDKEVVEAISAKSALPEIQAETIKWSRVIRDVAKTIPKVKGTDIVEILSYSGSSSRAISLNVKTIPERGESYFDVADLIEAFDNSNIFDGSFVPSIASGTDDEGREVLNFTLSTSYVEEDPLALLDAVEAEGALGDTSSGAVLR